MTAKVDEVLASIPLLKIDLTDIFDFKDQCFDPLAIEIIGESLDYALETSVRRLESVAKINPAIRENATKTILPAVKTLRKLIGSAPECSASALGAAPVAPPKTRTSTTSTTSTKKKETAKKPEQLVENITKAVTKATSAEAAKKVTPARAAPTEASVLAALSPNVRKSLENIKKNDMSQYVEIIEGLRAGKKIQDVLTGGFTGAQKIGPGKQFTLALAEGPQTYFIVDPKVAVDATQQPETGVKKLSASTALAKAVEGRKKGDNVTLKLSGKDYRVPITEVEEGHLKVSKIEVPRSERLPLPKYRGELEEEE